MSQTPQAMKLQLIKKKQKLKPQPDVRLMPTPMFIVKLKIQPGRPIGVMSMGQMNLF
jgi:hypothetical protein